MRHLDEGTLHAYLDDALVGDAGDTSESQKVEQHLSVCGECRARLDAARLLRENAAAILAVAGPADVIRPSFEELQARANARRDAGRRRDRKEAESEHRRLYRMKSLAWAATIILAAAVGWFARSTILPSRQDRYASEDEAGGRLAITVPDMQTANADTIEDQDQYQSHGAAQDELLTDTRLDEPRNEQAAPEAGGVLTAPAEREETPVARQSVVSTSAGAEDRQVQPKMQEIAHTRQQVTAEAVPTAPAVARALTSPVTDAESVWRSIDEATAAAILDAPVPVIDGLPIIGYAASAFNGRQAVRVQQSLESGTLLELVITVGADVAQDAIAKKDFESLEASGGVIEESVNSLTVQRGSLNVRLSAALAVDSLRALSELVRSGS